MTDKKLNDPHPFYMLGELVSHIDLKKEPKDPVTPWHECEFYSEGMCNFNTESNSYFADPKMAADHCKKDIQIDCLCGIWDKKNPPEDNKEPEDWKQRMDNNLKKIDKNHSR